MPDETDETSEPICAACGQQGVATLDPPLCQDCERAAAALWRQENPEMSIYACDADMKRRYRQRIIDIKARDQNA